MAFTDYQLARLKPGTSRRIITETGMPPDLRGLQLWLFPSGSKTFMFRFKVNGRSRYLKIGSYPTVGLAEAHKLVQGYRSKLKEGIDPQEQKEAVLRANRAAPTVRHIYEDFRDHYLRKKRKRPAEAEAILENHIIGQWGTRKAKGITRREIIERIREIAEDRGPRIAEVTKGLLGQMFNYAVDTGLLDASPAVRIPVIGSRGEQRERILTDDEVRTLWQKLDTAKMDTPTRLAVRLLLVTGQRRQEVALARWDHIDKTLWTIPAANSKNGRAHTVPLSKLATAILGELKGAQEDKADRVDRPVSEFLVPSRLVEDRPADPLAITRAVRKNLTHFGIPAFTVHDLRRTVASGLSSLGVSRLHVMKVLNHTDSSVTARYDRHDYGAEKRQALDLWAGHLQAVLAGKKSKVTPIKRRIAR